MQLSNWPSFCSLEVSEPRYSPDHPDNQKVSRCLSPAGLETPEARPRTAPPIPELLSSPLDTTYSAISPISLAHQALQCRPRPCKSNTKPAWNCPSNSPWPRPLPSVHPFQPFPFLQEGPFQRHPLLSNRVKPGTRSQCMRQAVVWEEGPAQPAEKRGCGKPLSAQGSVGWSPPFQQQAPHGRWHLGPSLSRTHTSTHWPSVTPTQAHSHVGTHQPTTPQQWQVEGNPRPSWTPVFPPPTAETLDQALWQPKTSWNLAWRGKEVLRPAQVSHSP